MVCYFPVQTPWLGKAISADQIGELAYLQYFQKKSMDSFIFDIEIKKRETRVIVLNGFSQSWSIISVEETDASFWFSVSE